MNRHTPITEQLAHIPQNRVALSNGQGTVLTYAELLLEVEAVRNSFSTLNITGFATLMDNSPAHVIVLIAAMNTQTWTLPLPLFFTEEQRHNALEESGCSALLSDREIPALTEVTRLIIGGSLLYLYKTGMENTNRVFEGTYLVTFTSGSTGDPKGLCLSAEHIIDTSQSVATAVDSLSIKRHLSILPLSILLEQTAGVFAALLSGAECIVPSLTLTGVQGNSDTKASGIYEILKNSKAHSCILVPELLKALLKNDKNKLKELTTLRFLAVGGAKTSPNLFHEANDLNLPVYEGYGLSEAGSVITLNTPLHNSQGSVGFPLRPETISLSSDGEVYLNNPSFLGYCNCEETPTIPFPTGDLGEFDEFGYLQIHGRKKNVLITSMGRNVSPEWIESNLLSSKFIDQTCIYGDGEESLSALVVSKHSDAVIQQAINEINLTLPDYARIEHWTRVPAFSTTNETLTGNGKLRRNTISMLYLHNSQSNYSNQERL